MANKNRVVGQSKIKYDGGLLETDGSSTLELGGAKRDPVMGDYQAGSFRETTEASKLSVNILVKPGTSLTALRDITDATVTHEVDTGQTYIIRGAYVAEVISLNTSEGKASLVFQGPPAEEI